jgi:hypothetical protein
VGCRITKRKATPATYQLLLASTEVALACILTNTKWSTNGMFVDA